MSEWVPVKNKVRKRPSAKTRVVAPKLIWITEDDWNNRFDPIDKEVYYILKHHHPKMLSVSRILCLVKALNEEENEDYVEQDISDSLELCLKAYLIADLGDKTYQLKLKV